MQCWEYFASTAYVYSSFMFDSAGQHPEKLICDSETIVSNCNLILGELRMKHLREETTVQASQISTLLYKINILWD